MQVFIHPFPPVPELTPSIQDLQEHGQVPSELIRELAPGLEFTSEGLPILPNLRSSAPGSGLPDGAGSFPFPSGEGGCGVQ